ncbi:MAG: 2-C-methyl-D-erythritol 2,4-cyclodiphosphate synthase [bacterium]
MKIGIGYDIHCLKKNRKLILGGVEIPYLFGLFGHSDADVLLHAICDAILGACGQGDIGIHFPNTNPEYKNISSLILLKKVNELLKKRKLKINNIDTTILAEEPKLSPYYEEMKKNIAKTLNTISKNINIKSTTMEKLGSIGKKKAIAAYAIVSIK